MKNLIMMIGFITLMIIDFASVMYWINYHDNKQMLMVVIIINLIAIAFLIISNSKLGKKLFSII